MSHSADLSTAGLQCGALGRHGNCVHLEPCVCPWGLETQQAVSKCTHRTGLTDQGIKEHAAGAGVPQDVGPCLGPPQTPAVARALPEHDTGGQSLPGQSTCRLGSPRTSVTLYLGYVHTQL